MAFEYRVVPAPNRGKRGKGRKGLDGRFANSLELTINELAREGWEYVRAESLPSNDKNGIGRRRTETYQNVLVFRREASPEFLETKPKRRGPFGILGPKKVAAETSAREEPELGEVDASSPSSDADAVQEDPQLSASNAEDAVGEVDETSDAQVEDDAETSGSQDASSQSGQEEADADESANDESLDKDADSEEPKEEETEEAKKPAKPKSKSKTTKSAKKSKKA